MAVFRKKNRWGFFGLGLIYVEKQTLESILNKNLEKNDFTEDEYSAKNNIWLMINKRSFLFYRQINCFMFWQFVRHLQKPAKTLKIAPVKKRVVKNLEH